MSSTIFFFLFIPLLAFILLAVNLIFAPHNPYMEKNNVFECGFSSFLGQNRTQFSISFFIFALLFLLFDLEILLVYPYLVSAYTNGVYGLAIMLMFLLALTLGFAFELGKKALSIDSRQMSKVATNKSSKLSVLGKIWISDLGSRSYSTYCLPYSSKFKVKFESVSYKQFSSLATCLFNPYFFITGNYLPKPHRFVHLRLQSGFFRSKKSNLTSLKLPLYIYIIIGVGLYLSYRFPIRFMLGQLDLLTLYALFNLIITLCSITILTYLKGKQVKLIQLHFAVLFALIVTFLTWYANGHHHDLCAFFIILSTCFSSIWPSIMTLSQPGNSIGESDLFSIKKLTCFAKKSLDLNPASSSTETGSAQTKAVSRVPAEIKEIILNYFHASEMDVKNKINAIFKDFHELESLYIEIIKIQDYIDELDIRVNEGNEYGRQGPEWNADLKRMQAEIKHLSQIQEQHISLQDRVSKDVSKLIRIKTLREAMIAKGFSFADEYIEHKDKQHLSNYLPKIRKISDMVKQLDSYKDWRKQER